MWWERMLAVALRAVVSAALLAVAVSVGFKLSQDLSKPASPPTVAEDAAPPAMRTAEQEATATVADRFLSAWTAGRYKDMYQMLSTASRKGLSEAQFTKLYRDLFAQGTITGVNAAVERFSIRELSRVKPPGVEEVPFTATFETVQMGRFSDRNFLQLVQEKGQWRVQWSPSAVVRDLAPKGRLILQQQGGMPDRGRILDRNGGPLVVTERVYRIGLVPGRMNDEAQMLAATSELLGLPQQELKAKYAKAHYTWLVPLGEVPVAREAEMRQKLGTVAGLVIEEVARRTYPQGGIAAPLLGIAGQFNPYDRGDARLYAGRGYQEGDWIGRSGIEEWGEHFLAGVRGGRMALRAPDGGTVRLLAQQPQHPGKDIATTLDAQVQQAAEAALGEASGSVVVLDIAERGVLAAASSPSFDPAAFFQNPNYQSWRWLLDTPESALQDRALTASYPFTPLLPGLLLAGGSVDQWIAALKELREVPGIQDVTPAAAPKGEITASPLQVAGLMAAVAGGGRLRTPVLVRQVQDRDGNVEQAFASKERGELPVTGDALPSLQERLRLEVMMMGGTAFEAFQGFGTPVAGLMGGAESGTGIEWFAGYAPAETPRYAVVVLLESGGVEQPNAAHVARTLLERLGL